MKHQQLDPTRPVTFELNTAELPSFSVEGSYEDVLPIYAELVESVKAKVSRSAPDAGAVTPRATTAIMSRLTVDFKARAYDLRNGTHFLRALREQRQLDKDLRMAQSLGLLQVDVCAKHRKSLDAVKSVR